jgi:hypothetical protein
MKNKKDGINGKRIPKRDPVVVYYKRRSHAVA